MSERLLESVMRFLRSEITLDEFVRSYIEGWRTERDSGDLLLDPPELSEKLSSCFCVVDLYNPREARRPYEFDENHLRANLRRVVNGESSSDA